MLTGIIRFECVKQQHNWSSQPCPVFLRKIWSWGSRHVGHQEPHRRRWPKEKRSTVSKGPPASCAPGAGRRLLWAHLLPALQAGSLESVRGIGLGKTWSKLEFQVTNFSHIGHFSTCVEVLRITLCLQTFSSVLKCWVFFFFFSDRLLESFLWGIQWTSEWVCSHLVHFL